ACAATAKRAASLAWQTTVIGSSTAVFDRGRPRWQRHRTVLRLVTFGGLGIESENASPPPGVRHARLALLAVLAAAGDRGVSRDRVAALFWPESDDTRARHSLRQSLYA